AILTADQSQKHGDRSKIGNGKEEFVKQRPIGNAADEAEEQLGARRINCAKFRVINFGGLRKIISKLVEFRIVRRDQVRVKSGALDFAFPLITPKIVARRERQRDKTESDSHSPEKDRLLPRSDVAFVLHSESVLWRK